MRTIITSEANGVATWDYSDMTNYVIPELSALPVDPAPSDDTIYTVNLVSATTTASVFKVWKTVEGITTPAEGVELRILGDFV